MFEFLKPLNCCSRCIGESTSDNCDGCLGTPCGLCYWCKKTKNETIDLSSVTDDKHSYQPKKPE